MSLLEPMHVTLRVREDVPNLRQEDVNTLLREVFCAMKSRAGFKILHYSIQSNHLHLILEAENNDVMSRGMTSLMTRIARRLNRFFGRVGRFFADRYHVVVMRTPKQVRRTIVYVLGNAWHHGLKIRQLFDRFTSAPWFAGWLESVHVKNIGHLEVPIEDYESMLMHRGVHQLGRIRVRERPS